jgi:serine/threonine protein kinase
MPTITPPASTVDLLNLVRSSRIHPPASVDERLAAIPDLPSDPHRAAEQLVRRGVLTQFQAKQLLAGRHRGFRLGSYVIQDQLGQGGMGAVYLAEHATLRRRVALKVLRAQRGVEAKVGVERFLREARAAAALDHPNIVRIHDVAQQDDIHYLALEYVEGRTLDKILSQGGAIAPSLAVGYIAQAAAGLQHAHEKGFVHRDIKPANLILASDGTVKLLDMGLARSLTSAADNLTEMLDKGAVVGTADFIAPEQALGAQPDIRADVYSLGATFFALVTGKPPFHGNTSQKLAQHQMKPAPDLAAQDPTFPPELARVVAKMLAKKPEERYQTPAELIAALAPWLSDAGEQKVVVGLSGTDEGSSGRLRETLASKRTKRTEAKPATAPPEPAGPARRSRKVWIGAAAGLVLVVAVVAYAAWPSGKPSGVPTAQTPPVAPPAAPPAGGPNNTPPGPDKSGTPSTPRTTPKVAVTARDDGFHVQTPKYEAVVDKTDGCLSSFRVAGTEFLRNGASLAGGRTNARGGYFYYEKAGHQGLVKLPEIQQPAPNVIIATGGSFTVRYEFGPNAVTVTAQNATDDTVPYFLLFDSEGVNDVANEKGEYLSLPATKGQGEPLDPKWRTTTWVAGRASVKVTDQTEDATTKIWGPFSEFRSQVWESDAKTYNRVQFTLEPSAGADEPTPALTPGAVLVSRSGAARRVRTELYETLVDRDGCMPSLRIDGVEVLKAGINVSRGVYFLPGYPLPFDIKQPAPTTITAQCDKAAIQYDFSPDKITWTVENRSDRGMPFFVVMDTSVMGVQNGAGEWVKLPVNKDAGAAGGEAWKATTWYAGRAKLKITGGSKVWGPWEGSYQVWEASMAPKEKRVVTVEIGLTDAAEADKLGGLTGVKPALATDLTLDAPMDYQVFQRKTKFQGAMTVRGRVRTAYDKLEVRTVGKSLQGPLPDQWRELPTAAKGREFEASLPTPAGGWYKVEVRALKDGKAVGQMAVEHVGVGEVFIGAGQSNSTNCGQEKIQQKSGMVSSFSGTGWQLGDDPQPGVHDNTTGGSYWPAFGDAMFEEYQVPIGVASTGHSGTSVNQWSPGGELCRWTAARMKQFGPNGFRAVLWHQGESDVAMAADEYARKMTALIRETQKSAGWEVPWFVAQVSYHNPNSVSFPNPRAGQKKLWETGIAYEGPDTDTLTGDNRDEGGRGIHFSPKGLRAHGKMWAEKLAVYLDKELAK